MLYSSGFIKVVSLWICLTLLACGGGGSEGGKSSTNPPSNTVSEDLTATPQGRMQLAMSSADASVLKTEDASFLLSSALNSFQSSKTDQDKLINALYAGQSPGFELVRESFMIQPNFASSDKVFPLVMGDKGNTLASISTVYDNRIAGYGYDILSGFDPTNTLQSSVRSSQPIHKPVFKRVLAWLATGNPMFDWSQSSPSALNVAWSSLPTSSSVMFTNSKGVKVYKPHAAGGLAALGVPFTSLSCDPLSEPVKDCAAKAQLVVVGAIDRRTGVDLSTQLTRIQDIVRAKIPVLYLNAHPDGGWANDFARAAFEDDFKRLKALGFAYGDDPDKRNYYIQDFVSANYSVAQLRTKFDHVGNLMSRLSTSNFVKYDWRNCFDKNCVLPTDFVNDIDNPLKFVMGKLNEMDMNGETLFDADLNNKTIRQFVLWADTYRRTINYPIDKDKQSDKFQPAYIADSLVSYVRKKGGVQSNLGNYLGPQAFAVKGSVSDELVEVTLPGTKGMTAVGRFVLPGQVAEIKWQGAPPIGNFKLRINVMAEGTTKKWEPTTNANGQDEPTSGLRRPLYLRSPEILFKNEGISMVSPYGGMLQLVFDNAQTSKVSLLIKGTAKHPFYDTTQGAADPQAFMKEVRSSPLGWLEIKTPAFEVHSIVSKALEFLEPPVTETYAQRAKYPNAVKPYYHRDNGIDMAKYLDEGNKYVMQSTYGLAGFQVKGVDLTPSVKQICAERQWDCTSTAIHALPTIQHFHHDIRSNCGSMCSGNPIHSSSGFAPRDWGEGHEMGHNVQRFKVYDGKSGEVSNNIFPLHKRWKLFNDMGREQTGYVNELDETQTVFDMIKNIHKNSTLSTAEAKRAKVKSMLWSDPAYAVQNRSRLYFYLQWLMIYQEVLKEKNPSLSDDASWQQAWDIYTLMYLNLRQVDFASANDWPQVKHKLGFGQYDAKPATSAASVTVGGTETYPHHDYLLVVLSMLTGRNLIPLFDLWGIDTYEQGRNQVLSLNLPLQDNLFYAVVCTDDFRTKRVIDLNQTNPVLPAEWGTTPFKDQASNRAACQAATTAYLANQ